MSKIVWYCISAAVVLAFFVAAPVSAQPMLTDNGFTENFDSMGQDGDTPPGGWSMWTIPGSNSNWVPPVGIPPDQMSPELFGTPRGPLRFWVLPSYGAAGTNNNGWNMASDDNPDDRSLAGGPTGVAGAVIELV